jgi:ribosomal protein S18 acetylase RimI-like enzyme
MLRKRRIQRNEVALSGYVPGALGKITELHALYYYRHWNFGLFFERKVATELAEFLGRFQKARDGFWLAMRGDRIAGSIALDGIDAEDRGAHLRWFIVDPEDQGAGIGDRLLKEALAFSDGHSYRKIRLWTFSGLDTARHLYETNGFRLCTEQEDDRWGVRVTEQLFERDIELHGNSF